MGIKIILLVCLYPVLFILYFALKSEVESSARSGRAYCGVRLTKQQADTPEVKKVFKEYVRQMKAVLVFFALIPFPALFIPWFSVYFTFEMVWMLALIICCVLPFVSGNVKLKALKRERGWRKEEERYLAVELKNAGKIRRVRLIQFAPPVFISAAVFAGALSGLFGETPRDMSAAVGCIACMTPLLYAVARWMDNLPTRVISTESDTNSNYARAGKQIWKNFWLCNAWLNTLYTVCMILAFGGTGGLWEIFLPASVVYLAAVLALLVWAFREKRKLDILYAPRMDMEPADDDDNWIGGVLYYNPQDGHTFVGKKDGTGVTVNMARPGGKLMAVCCILAVAWALFACVWVMLVEFTPIRLEVKEERLVASQIKEDYSIPLAGIKDPALLEELPSLSKVSGTGMDTLLKGTFRIPQEGRCQVFLNPQNTVFIYFEYGGTAYYVSGRDDEETREAWEDMMSWDFPEN